MITLLNKLYESLLDDEVELVNDDITAINQFLKDNYNITGSIDIKNNTVNVSGCVILTNKKLKSLTGGLFKFGEVGMDFRCDNSNITTLKGAPEKVKGIFDCGFCKNLTSLNGSPKEVGDMFNCDGNRKLLNLNGSPEKVGTYNCSECDNITSLEGISKNIKDSIWCERCRNLTSLKGAPKLLKGTLDVEGCRNLTSLKDGPTKINKALRITKSGINPTELKDIIVKGPIIK